MHLQKVFVAGPRRLTDDLAHCCEVRCDAKVLLRASMCNSEAGHDLIKTEKSAILLGDVSQSLYKPACQPAVAANL